MHERSCTEPFLEYYVDKSVHEIRREVGEDAEEVGIELSQVLVVFGLV